MNFKKYHVSKNLLNFDDLKNAESGTISTKNGQETFAVPHVLLIQAQPNTVYVLSTNYEKTGSKTNVIYYNYADASYAVYSTNSVYMTTSETGLIKIAFFDTRIGADDFLSGDSWLMLNTGSTPLPYEPYSSEVWHDVPYYIHNTSTDTITTLPAIIHPTGTTATVGLKGQTVQSSTPSPTSPVMPQGTGERTGNLVRFYKEEMQERFYGVDVTVKNAEITLNGTVTTGSGHWVEIGYKFGGGTESTDNVVIPCEPETSYTITTEILDGDSSAVRLITFGTSNENKTVNIGSSLSTIFSDNINRIFISLGAEGVVFNNLKFRVMLNKGSTALPYEPYGIKIPILNNSQTTNVYLGEVETTRKIGKYIFTGDENITCSVSASNVRMYYVIPSAAGASPLYCTHFVDYAQAAGYPPVGYCNFNNISNFIMGVDGTEFETANDFKTWLRTQYTNGNPLTVWYVLATEETGIVNEPLRKIGDYADEVSGITIPTIAGANTLSVDTTLQPSEVTATYKGWHPVADVHEKSVNLAPPNSEWVSGYIDAAGALRPAEGTRYEKSSDFIEIQPDTDYAFSCNGGFPDIDTDDPWRGICTYDANKNYILRRAGNTTNSISITTESNAKYVRLSCRTYGKDIEPMLNEGSTVLPYEPYWT